MKWTGHPCRGTRKRADQGTTALISPQGALGSFGSTMRNVLPTCNWLSTVTSPPSSLASRRVVLSPSPLPPALRVFVLLDLPERLEDVLEILRRDANPRILNLEHDVGAAGEGPDGDAPAAP